MIVGGFARNEEFSSSRKKFVKQAIYITNAPCVDRAIPSSEIVFSSRDVEKVIPHEDDPMVINLQIYDWNVK